MPTYEINDPNTGKTLELDGDSPPTEQELIEVFSQFQQASTPTEAPQQSFAQRVQSALSKTYGTIADKAMKSDILPMPIKAPVVLGAKVGQMAVEHPKEAAIAAGTGIGAALTGGSSLIMQAGAAGLGAAAGEGYGQIMERVLGKKTPATSWEATKKIAKTGETAAVSTLAAGGLHKGLIKPIIGKAKSLYRAATSSPNVPEAQQAVETAKDVLTTSKEATKKAYLEAIENARNATKASDALIGDVVEETGLGKVKISHIPTEENAPLFARELQVTANDLKGATNEQLYEKVKQSQEFFVAHPQMKAGSDIGRQIIHEKTLIKDELRRRIKDYDQAVATNYEARQQLMALKKGGLKPSASDLEAGQNLTQAKEEVTKTIQQLKEKEVAVKKVKVALVATLGTLGVGARKLVRGVKKAATFLGD